MGRRTDYKVDKIKTFILNNNPTRSEIIKHIVVDINKKVSSEFFDKHHRSYRGYYGCNIYKMCKSGNIASKNGKYYITEQGITNENSLYNKPTLIALKDEVKHLRRQLQWTRKNALIEYNNTIYIRDENKRLKATLRNINMLSGEEI